MLITLSERVGLLLTSLSVPLLLYSGLSRDERLVSCNLSFVIRLRDANALAEYDVYDN